MRLKKRSPNRPTTYACEKCGQTFSLNKKTAKKHLCPRCRRLLNLEKLRAVAYHKRPEYREKQRIRYLKANYDMCDADYESLLESQGGTCAICKLSSEQRLVIDHDHHTKGVRGLLCQKCNRALGSLNDDLAIIRRAESYLLRSRKQSWDNYFVEMARLCATRSKDSSGQVGAVLVKDRTILSMGYNGFPRGINDERPERQKRPEKYLWTIHAEENAILNAARYGIGIKGTTLYVTPFSPCARCASFIAQSGIIEVVIDKQYENPRFEEEFRIANRIFQSTKIIIREPE